MRMGERPLPPEEPVVASVYDPGRTRRHALGVIAGTTAFMLVDFGVKFGIEEWTENVWPDNDTTISTVKGSQRLLLPDSNKEKSPWIAFGGLGRQYNLDQAENLAYVALGLPDQTTAMVGGLNHANQGISFYDNALRMHEYTEGSAGMKLLGHSMGMLTALKSALYMPKAIHIDEIIAVSSPSGIDDVFRKQEVAWVVEHGLEGDIAQKFLFDLIVDHSSDRRNFFSRIGDVVTRAARNAPKGVSPMVYVDQLEIVYREDARNLILQLAERGMITSKTRVRYCKSPRDNTVIADQACNTYTEAFKEVDADVSVVVFDGPHADTKAACKASARWCRLAPDFAIA